MAIPVTILNTEDEIDFHGRLPKIYVNYIQEQYHQQLNTGLKILIEKDKNTKIKSEMNQNLLIFNFGIFFVTFGLFMSHLIIYAVFEILGFILTSYGVILMYGTLKKWRRLRKYEMGTKNG